MCSFKTLGVSWPPSGWEQFKEIEYSSRQAIVKDPATARVVGLSYAVEFLPLYHRNDVRELVYAIQIDGWEYTIRNESREYPILSFVLRGKSKHVPDRCEQIADIRVKSCQWPCSRRLADRVVRASLFFMKQINGSSVPDVEKVLKLYKIHPDQKKMYDLEGTDHTSLIDCDFLTRIRKEDGMESY